MKLENTDGDGTIALPARILLDTLKEFSVQPLTFDIYMENPCGCLSVQKMVNSMLWGRMVSTFLLCLQLKKIKNLNFVIKC